jgi:hypothetical protein
VRPLSISALLIFAVLTFALIFRSVLSHNFRFDCSTRKTIHSSPQKVLKSVVRRDTLGTSFKATFAAVVICSRFVSVAQSRPEVKRPRSLKRRSFLIVECTLLRPKQKQLFCQPEAEPRRTKQQRTEQKAPNSILLTGSSHNVLFVLHFRALSHLPLLSLSHRHSPTFNQQPHSSFPMSRQRSTRSRSSK